MSFLFSKHKKQLEAIFDWLSGVVNQDDLILVEREGKREGYYFEFPLKFGDKPRKIKTLDINDCTFWVRFFSGGIVPERNKWRLIFQSPELEIYEHEKRLQKNQFRPVRWGLNEEEKRTALKIARKSLEIFLKDKKKPHFEDLDIFLPKIFNLRADLDVALWVNGALRGSYVGENKILSDGFIEAAIGASRDLRFKPLDFEELAFTRIEITLFSDLKIPLSKNLLDKNEIFHNKGYLIRRGSKKGWFLPEVFNVLSFKTLKEFLSRLGSEKAFLREEEIFNKRTEFFIFEVEDFIESGDREEILNLDGPIALLKNQNTTIEKSASSAADWLLKMQETDGNFIPIINPLTGKTSQLDWPRSIFTGWSLIEFGKAVGDSRYVEAGRKNFSYGKKYILDEQIIKNSNSECLTLAYLGQEAMNLDYREDALRCGNRILEKENQLKFEPILFSQISSFLVELSKIDKNFMAPALGFGEKTRVAFDDDLRQRRFMQLAVWAELANLYLKLFEIQNNSFHLQTVRKVIDWLLNYQLGNGSFRAANDSDSSFVYTRGTGKIFEVLAGSPEFRDAAEKSLVWLLTTQYTEENTFFTPKDIRLKIVGALRHDYFNQEAWIDSAGHFLLGASRFLKHFNL